MLPHRLRLNVARVAAVMLPERAVGSIWTPCRPHDPDIAKALCLYLNSTPGLLSLLGARDNRVPSYPSFSLDTLRSLPAPNFAALGAAERDLLRCWFDWLRGEVLQPFPQMHDDPVRKQIDDAVCQSVGPGPGMGCDDTARAGAGAVGYGCWRAALRRFVTRTRLSLSFRTQRSEESWGRCLQRKGRQSMVTC